MNKQESKRFLSLLLAFVMVLGLLPIHALAAENQSVSVLEGQITVTSSGTNAAISSADDVVTASVYATKNSGCTGDTYEANTNTVTITNSSGADSTLFFRYALSLNSGSLSINGDNKTESGTFTAQVAAGESVTISLTSNDSSTTAASVMLSDFSLIGSSAYTVQFTKPVGGIATVNGTDLSTLTDGAALEVSATYADGVPVTATANTGYEFVGWLDENNTVLLATANGTIYPTQNCTVTPLFVPTGTALFGIGSKVYDNLSEAANIATSGIDKTIVLLNNGTLDAGDYTIPTGVTLLIPFDAANTCYTTAPEVLYGSHTTPSAYRTLTLASGVSITVNGAISVSSKVSSTGTGSASWNGTPTGPHGKIVMSEGSVITLNSGASLYAWGYVAGTGTVTALSGANVYECFQIRNWRGGSATTSSTMETYKIFPISQYYVQNIEAKLVLNAGAKETVFTAPNMASSAWPASAAFIGAGGMFQITSGSVTKQYLPDTDQLQIDVNGDISIFPISLTISYISLDSGSYVLPVNSNIVIYVHSGSTTISQDLALLPGAELHIDGGANVNIASGKNVYVYDKDEWGAYAYASGQMNPVGYSTVNGTTAKRTAAGLTDAKVDVNGTVTANGSIYTTQGGAEIISTDGTGKITFVNGAGTETVTYQATQSNTTMTKVDIPISSAQLKNADGSFTETSGCVAGTTYTYVVDKWKNGAAETTYTVTWKNADGTVLETDTEVAEGAIPEYNGEIPTKAEDEQYTYTFAGWTPELSAITEDVTYTATFTAVPKTFTITWKNEDGTVLETDENVPYGATPSYDGEVPAKTGDAQYSYTFAGWTPETTSVTGDAVYTATYTQATNTYTVTWKNDDGTILETDTVPYGDVPVYNGATPTKAADAQYTYIFAGWDIDVTAVTGDTTYTATYSYTVNTYTVTWKDEDGSVLGTTEVAYGTIPTYDGTPTKAGDAQYSYTFAGWTPEVEAVTGAATYTATYTQAVNEYTVTWKNDDGTVLKTESVSYGTIPVYDGMPVKAGNAQYSYSFAGWDVDVVAVTGDITYTAVYTATVNEYTITWKNDDGSVLGTSTVAYGSIPGFNGTPSKDADAQYSYTFAGWTPEVETVTGDATYTATYTAAINSYTVIWMDTDGTVLQTDENVAYGTTPEFSGVAPSKEADAQYTYTFTGWTPDVSAVVGNVTYKAVYEQTLRQYTITWLDDDGITILATNAVDYGTVPSYPGDTPVKTSDIHNTYVFAGWTPELAMVTGEASYKAVYTATPVVHTVTWLNDDGTVLATSTFTDGEAIPDFEGIPTKEATVQYTYNFLEWKQDTDEATGDVTLTAVYEATVNKYSIIFTDDEDNILNSFCVEYGQMPSFGPVDPTKETDNNYYAYEFKGWEPTLEAVTGPATYKAVFEKVGRTGWIPEDAGTTYIENGEQIYKNAWATIDDTIYYFDEAGYIVKGIYKTTSQDGTYEAMFIFDNATGIFLKDQNGLYNSGEDTYWTQNGEIVEETGLRRIVTETGDINYYYFGEDFKAYKATEDTDHYVVEKNNGLALPEGINYVFGKDGIIKHFEDTSINGIYFDESSSNYYYCVDGVIIANGLMLIDGSYYYAKTSTGAFVRSCSYWITLTHDLLEEGIYTFDEYGKIIFPEETEKKDGIVEENGSLYYYVDGIVTGAGLIRIDGDYYYVRTSNGEVVHGRTYWITATNDLLPSGLYTFADDGKMVNPPVIDPDPTKPEPEVKNGIVAENSSLYYYVDGVVTGAGLIQIDSDYYYAKTSNGEIVHGRTYWITTTNDLLPSGQYAFADDGKMIIE